MSQELPQMYPGEWAFQLMPLHGPYSSCPAPGKMPKLNDWVNLPGRLRAEGVTREQIYESIMEQMREGDNVGLIVPDGVAVFDCDEPTKVEQLLALYPDAPAQLTRRGGLHLFFRLNPGEALSNAQKVTLNGATGDIRALGGQVVVCPSVGAGGGLYRWLRPLPADMKELPLRPEEMMVAAIRRSNLVFTKRDHGPRPDLPGDRPSAKDLSPLKSFNEGIYERVLKGQPVAETGSRDNTLTSVIGAILVHGDTVDPRVPFKLLAHSVAADQSPGAPTLDNLWSKCCRLCDKHGEEKAKLVAIRDAMMKRRQETAEGAARKEGSSVEDIKRRLVIYTTGAQQYYVFNEGSGRYYGPVGSNGLVERLERLCPSMLDDGALRDEKGKSRSDKDILSAYGTPVYGIEMRYGEDGARYDAGGGRLIMGVWQKRQELKAEFDERVDRWLRLLGGDHPEKLLDWLATVTQLNFPSCAIYLRGPKKAGKGMLAQGLARIWGQPYTPYRLAVSRFNDALVRCPLVFLDEGLSQGQESTIFREFVAASELTVERKFQSPLTLVGSPRIIIASNSDDALKIRDEVTSEDLDAIIDRIGWIEISPECPRYLESIGGRHQGTTDWVDGDRIAKHVLWLTETRKVTPGSRFMVEGWDHPKLRRLPSRMRGTGEVLAALAHHLADVVANNKMVNGRMGIVAHKGHLYVNVPALVEYWDSSGMRLGQRPSEAAIGRALRTVSSGRRLVSLADGSRVRAWDVDVEQVFQTAEEVGIGDIQRIRKHVTGATAAGIEADSEA